MPDMLYSAMLAHANDPGWVARVTVAVTLTAANVKVKAAPSGATEIAEDALGRLILQSPATYGARFALPVALGFIGDADLEPGTVTDAAIFARVAALYRSFLPNPA